MIEDLKDVLSKVEPWTAENIQKAVDRYAKRYVYTLLAGIVQGKTKDYLPMCPTLELMGKDKVLNRLQ